MAVFVEESKDITEEVWKYLKEKGYVLGTRDTYKRLKQLEFSSWGFVIFKKPDAENKHIKKICLAKFLGEFFEDEYIIHIQVLGEENMDLAINLAHELDGEFSVEFSPLKIKVRLFSKRLQYEGQGCPD